MKKTFFSHDKNFYAALFPLLIIISLQNLISYSVNMADNIMLGAYSQNALSGAALVNQVFFLIQQAAVVIGDGLVVIASQYWGQKRMEPIRQITGMVLKIAFCLGIFLILLCSLFPDAILRFFTSDTAILSEAGSYLQIIKYTFLLYLVTQVLLSALRSVETVRIAFVISCVSLVVNVSINYTLIYGRFGFPELGIRGAAIGTMISRCLEFLIVFIYVIKIDKKLKLFSDKAVFHIDKLLRSDYVKVAVPVFISGMLWAISVPMQTAILGHLSPDAIAANSVASTFYQYMKVVVLAMSSASSVMMGKAVGKGDLDEVKAAARTLSVLDGGIGMILGAVLYFTKDFLLAQYTLSPTATQLTEQLIIIMAIVMVGMAYQMPVGSGIIRGAGDTKFSLYVNMISTWGIVLPLSLSAAFWWKWPIPAVVICLQSDQIFKGLPIFLRFRSYKWIHKLTRDK